MNKTQSFMDLLSTNLATIFHRYLFIKNKQTCSHILSKNVVKKAVRINMNKYGYLLNPIYSQRINKNLQLNENKLKSSNKQIKVKKMDKKNKRRRKKKKSKKKNIQLKNNLQPAKIIITPSSTSSSQVQSPRDSPSSFTSKITGRHIPKIKHTSSTISELDRTETPTSKQERDSINSTLHRSNQCRDTMKRLYNMNPIVNKNYVNTRNLSSQVNLINTRQHEKIRQYSKGLKPEQLFRCPKDSRSKRRKCCGIYYELFDDAWRILEGWFTMENK